jgi:hypothetical protein
VLVALAALSVLGALGAGCLTRPVEGLPPTSTTTFSKPQTNTSVDKIDLLFMIDNSASMGDKQALLAAAVPDMIHRLVAPNCVDSNGQPFNPNVTAGLDGSCTQGTAEFPPVHDMHVGIVTSSLGGRGGDACAADYANPANGALNAHNDDRGELISRGGVANMPTVENMVGDIAPSNYLGWFPSVGTLNSGHTGPTGTPIMSADTLISDFTTMVEGVHEHGCGYEAQNEAWYRFLVQPDPFDTITLVSNGKATVAQLNGVDKTILQQRHDFLRPDSLLAVIVVTDENEEVADPLAIGGQGWAFDMGEFPNSPTKASPQGTTDCQNIDANNPSATGPNDPNCKPCPFLKSSDPTYAARCPPDGTTGTSGYLDPNDDQANTRFYQQKRRFGVTSMYPTSRYVRGLQQMTVPSSDHEHDGNGNYIGDQDANANCRNPIYATDLPTDPSADLCGLTEGKRDPSLVYYAAIAGVPHELLQAKAGDPNDPTCPAGTPQADCPQKDALSDADWKLIMGTDPEHYDFRGADFHMVEDWNPRTGGGPLTESPWQASGVLANVSKCPPVGGTPQGLGCDPINGGEWQPNKGDLQFACIFDLRPQYGGVGKDCTNQIYAGACDCQPGSANMGPALDLGTQLCDKTRPSLQIYGKAYPSVREMIIAKAMSTSTVGNQGIVSSLCPIHVSDNAQMNDPLYGYRPAVGAIINRLKKSLNKQCVPQPLEQDDAGNVPCLILVQLGNKVGPGACANPPTDMTGCDPTLGLLAPGVLPLGAPASASAPLTQDILTQFCKAQEAGYKGMPGADGDPDLYPTCALQQLTPSYNPSDFPSGSCAASNDPGWCYVAGQTDGGCAQSIVFSKGEPPSKSTAFLQCLEKSVIVTGDGG